MYRNKHTPGPWFCAAECHQGCEDYKKFAHYRISNLLLNRYPTSEEASANEHLIAHAPDLLDALKQTVAAVEDLWPKASAFWDTKDGQRLCEIFNNAEMAIDRAEGRKK